MEPRFDDPDAQMPRLGLSRAEAQTIADELLRSGGGASALERAAKQVRSVVWFLPTSRGGDVAAGFVLGLAAGLLALLAALALSSLWRQLRRPGGR